MREPDRDAAAMKLRQDLVDLLHWDRLPGLHATGLAQWQMWVLASREGHLNVSKRRTGATGKKA